MTIKAYCAGCGEDCSNCYGTWYGEPYHIGCIPTKPRKRKKEEDGDGLERPVYDVAGG